MMNEGLFRKEATGSDLLSKEMNDYTKVPSPNKVMIIFIILISIVILLIYMLFRKIEMGFLAFAYDNGDVITFYLNEKQIKLVDVESKFVINDKVYKVPKEAIDNAEKVMVRDLIDKEYTENSKNESLDNFVYCVKIDDENLSDDFYEVNVITHESNLFDMIFGKDVSK